MVDETKVVRLEDFVGQAYDKLRYGDTDRQGHVNNAVFATFMETGRVELIYNPEDPLAFKFSLNNEALDDYEILALQLLLKGILADRLD